MKLILILFFILLFGCSSTSYQRLYFKPIANTCQLAYVNNFWSSAVESECWNEKAQYIQSASAVKTNTPVNMIESLTNAAILGAAIPLTAALFNPTVRLLVK